MDKDLLKTLLQTQQEAYKGATEMLTNQFNNKIVQLESKISELQRSLEFSQQEITELATEKRKIISERSEDRKRLSELTDDNELLRTRLSDLEARLNYNEDHSRRNNLRISGVTESEGGETWEQTAVSLKSLLENKLELPPLRIERAHRTGQRVDNKPRTIVARFTSYADREMVMRNARKLKGTRIYINEDLCPASQEIVKQQLPRLRKAKQEGKIAYFRHTKLIIKERNQPSNREYQRAANVDEGVAAQPAAPVQDSEEAMRNEPETQEESEALRGSPVRGAAAAPRSEEGALTASGGHSGAGSYANRTKKNVSDNTRTSKSKRK